MLERSAHMKNSHSFQSTKKLALSALFAALCFITMYIGNIAVVFDLCSVTVSALIIIISVIEIKGMYPWLIWAVTSTLCLLILPDKYVALEFIMYGGIYPMIKSLLERLPIFAAWIAKILYFNAAFTLSVLIAKKVFLAADIGFELKGIAYICANIFFIISDICFTLLISSYIRTIRPRLKIGSRK